MAKPTKYIRSSVEVITSENSDYTDETYRSKVSSMLDSHQDYGVFESKETADSGGTIKYLTHFGTIEHMWVENLDDTYKVKVEYTSSAGSCKHWLNAGDWMKTPNIDNTANMTLTGNTANVDVRVILVTKMDTA